MADAAAPSGKEADGPWQRICDLAKSARQLAVDLAVIALIVGALVFVAREGVRDDIEFGPIEISPDLTDLKRGEFSSAAVTQGLLARVQNIFEAARIRNAPLTELDLPSDPKLEAALPGVGVSIEKISRYLREFLGYHRGHMVGDVTRVANSKSIQIRLWYEGHVSLGDIPSAESLDKSMDHAADAIVKSIAPYKWAAYLYERDDPRALDAIKEVIRTSKKPCDEVARAYLLWGRILRDQAEYDENKYKEAIDKDNISMSICPNQTVSYNNRGSVKLLMKDFEGAINDYERAIYLDSRYPNAYFNLGYSFEQKGDVSKAIGRYKLAIDLEPTNFNYHFYMGEALIEQGHADGAFALHFEEALDHYRTAVDFVPSADDAHSLGTKLERRAKGERGPAAAEVLLQACLAHRTAWRMAWDDMVGNDEMKTRTAETVIRELMANPSCTRSGSDVARSR